MSSALLKILPPATTRILCSPTSFYRNIFSPEVFLFVLPKKCLPSTILGF
jgi:hypothetical protein